MTDTDHASILDRNLSIPSDQIAAFCRRNHIRWLRLFGSVLTDEFDEKSDVDVLVEFDHDHVPGFGFFAMERELTDMLGREVDLNTKDFLSPYIREEVMREAWLVYAAP